MKLQDFPSLFQCPKLSIPLISAITAHPSCFNLAVTSLMPLLPPDLLVFPFTDVLSWVLSTARLIKALVLWGSNFLLQAALTNPYTWHFLAPVPPAFLKLIPTSAISPAQFPLQPHMAHLSLNIEGDNLEAIQRRDCRRD